MYSQFVSRHRTITRLALGVVLLAALSLLNGAGLAAAAASTLYVSATGSDANPCTATLPCRTIGHAISIAANGSTIRVAAGYYYENLTIGTTAGAFLTRLTIEGDGTSNTIIDGSGRGPVITVMSLSLVTISAVTIENGNEGSSLPSGGGITNHGTLNLVKSSVSKNIGGGIFNNGTLVMTDSNVKHNSTLLNGGGVVNFGTMTVTGSTIAGNIAVGDGGGILHAYGTMTVRQSTIAHNRAGYQGGGVYTQSDKPVMFLNSTVASNSSAVDGGGIFVDGLSNQGFGVSLYNDTIAKNEANTSLTGTSGGGLAVAAPSFVVMRNTILAANIVAKNSSPDFSLNDCESLATGLIASTGYNLVSTTSGCVYHSSVGDLPDTQALLGPLQNNGGLTATMALLSGSPAIDAGNPAGCTDQFGNLLTVDQRGDPRPHEGDGDGDNRCDIGAYEK